MSMGPWVSYRADTWLIDECQIAFFTSVVMLRNLAPPFFVVIFYVICLSVNNVSGILDTADTSFMQPWWWVVVGVQSHFHVKPNLD